MKHVRTIIRKEWSEVFKNRWVIATMTILPLLFTAMPLIVLATTGNTSPAGGAEMSGLPGDVSVKLSRNERRRVHPGLCFESIYALIYVAAANDSDHNCRL